MIPDLVRIANHLFNLKCVMLPILVYGIQILVHIALSLIKIIAFNTPNVYGEIIVASKGAH